MFSQQYPKNIDIFGKNIHGYFFCKDGYFLDIFLWISKKYRYFWEKYPWIFFVKISIFFWYVLDIFRIFLGYLISILYRRYFSDIFSFGYRDIKYRYYIHFWMISGYYLDISGYYLDIILILYRRYRYNIGYLLAKKYQYYIQNIQKIWILYP